MRIRPTTDADLPRVLACPVSDAVGLIPPGRYRGGLACHQYRPEWTWIAEDAGRILARAVWWGFGHAAHPVALDCVYADGSLPGRVALAARVIAAGQQALRPPGAGVAPRYEIGLPPAGALTPRSWRPSGGGGTLPPAPV